MEPKVVTSQRWTVSLMDFLNSMKLAVGIPVITYLMSCIGKGGIASVDWPTLANVAAGAFLGYLAKKWTDRPKTTVFVENNVQANVTTEMVKEALK